MRKVLTVGVALVAALSLAACNGAGKPSAAPAKAAAVAKPPLVVPASFKDDQDKLAFAAKAVDDKYYTEAVPLLQQIMISSPSADASKRLGTAKYNLNDYDGAIAAWTKAGELDPRLEAEMLNYVGNALRDQKKLDEAEASYRKALQIEPTQWTAAINLSDVLRDRGQVEAAVKVLEDADKDTGGKISQVSAMLDSLRRNL